MLKLLLYRLLEKIDRLIEYSGRFVSWLIILLLLTIVYDVFMRYLFGRGSIGLQEFEWHLFSVIFLLGAAYTLKHDEHVRLDILYRSRFMTDRLRAWIDVIGSVCLLLPFCLLVIISTWPFVSQAFVHNEISPDPGGLPARWLIKLMIPIGFALLMLQGIAETLKKLTSLIFEKDL